MDSHPAPRPEPPNRRGIDRRTFVQAGAALLGSQWLGALAAEGEEPPNLLVIVVDQMRAPAWFPDQKELARLLPALARLSDGAVSFGRHYTAASACTPSRACLLTGLYAHQNGILLTHTSGRQPALDPRFPTWGDALGARGYRTFWFGKWHLSYEQTLQPFGFAGGTFPDPIGLPGAGLRKDPDITTQFADWYASEGGRGPWCTSVSLINPHDIAWYPRTSRLRNPPRVFSQLPGNFETPDQLRAHGKPEISAAFQTFANVAFGVMRHGGPGYERPWLRMLDLYLYFQQQVDRQIGRILDTLARSPAVQRNTVVILTSDHGEYAGSHGLRGKSGPAYEEGLRIPLIVKDFTGRFVREAQVERTQLTSSVDVIGLLLSLAAGNSWREDPKLAHLAARPDLAAILANPKAPGRPFVLHTTEEPWPVTLPPRRRRAIPGHTLALRTPEAKLVTYSRWQPGTFAPIPESIQTELYDYSTQEGRLELRNASRSNPALLKQLSDALTEATRSELHRELPEPLQPVGQAAVRRYLEFVG